MCFPFQAEHPETIIFSEEEAVDIVVEETRSPPAISWIPLEIQSAKEVGIIFPWAVFPLFVWPPLPFNKLLSIKWSTQVQMTTTGIKVQIPWKHIYFPLR
jgi:hypothetical protein